MSLRGALRSSVAAACIAAVVAPASQAAQSTAAPARPQTPAAPAASPLQVKVAQSATFSRVEFHWTGGAAVTQKREGQVLTLRFSRDATPDIALLRATPPKWVKSADMRHERGALVIVITLEDNADARIGNADGSTFVNIFERAADAPAAETATAPPPPDQVPPPRPNPLPAGGVVHMAANINGPQIRFEFPFAAPLGAAVFQRDGAVWIVFDAPATLDVSRAPRGVPQYLSMQALKGANWSAVRIATPGPIAAVAEDTGSGWVVTLAPINRPAFTPLKVERSDDEGPPTLQAAVSGATGVFWIQDPAVGDRFAAVTARGPAKGLADPRTYLQFRLPRSAQGLAVEPLADNLDVAYSGDIVSITRPGGLILSSATAAEESAQAALGLPVPAPLPALFGADWGKSGPGGYARRFDQLAAAVAAQPNVVGQGSAAPHMALARFLIGSELSFEAIGVLDDALRLHPNLSSDAEFRGLRGMAKAMARRWAEASADFASPALADDPSAALWRAYIAAQTGQWDDVKRESAAGQSALVQFPPIWRARFARSAAQAALAQGDNASARTWIAFALEAPAPPIERLATRLLQAHLMEAEGDRARALAVYTAIEKAPADDLSAPATLRATQIKLDTGRITPIQAAAVFNSLRYRWRGDAFELETIRTLGQLYLAQGRYREALEAFKSAGNRMPDLPQAVQLQADLSAAFRSLFLDGQADGLEPVQALALFYDFRDLTPVGADGDLMVRRLVRRLVDVDLLDQAETLLKYQVENRLDGMAKAQVATDLAVIYLMDRKPEEALNAINATRTTLLTNDINATRRVVAARALAGLQRYDAALEMLGTDASGAASEVRAEVQWKQRAWPAAGASYERALGERWKTAGPLSLEEEGKLLRASVAYSLAGDDASLARLREHFQTFVDGARQPDALRVALSGVNGGPLSVADFGRATADNALFEGWVAKMKVRFRQLAAEPVPPRQTARAPAAPAAPAPASTAQAAPPPRAPAPRAG